MECVERALKSSFIRLEMVLKPTQQAFLDDIWTVHNNNNGPNGVSVDDFFVDDLLDFSKAGEEEEKEEGTEEKTLLLSGDEPHNGTNTDFLSPQQQQQEGNVKDFSGSVPDSELCVPADDLADLEWVSHFVDDSSSGYSLTLPAGKLSVKSTGNHADTEITGSDEPICTTPVQTKARSKRGRTGVLLWSNSLTDSTASSSSSSSYTSSSSPLNPWVMYNDLGQSADSLLGKPPAKKQRKKPATDVPGGGGGVQPRRCSHCLVQKTPQWRSGPLGAKTLCNACGVRYKSGRLLPEYRPACSPTFSSEIHSNNHRKVLEMRRKKEGDDAFALPVESF